MPELLKQAFTIIFARGFIRMAQLISFVLLARFLTPAEFGYFGIVASAIPLAAMLGSLGLRQSFAYEIGQKRLSSGDAVATMLVVWPVLAAISTVAVYYMVGSAVDEIATANLIAMIAMGVAGAMLIKMAQGVFLGTGDIARFSLTETFPRVLLTIAVALLALLQMVEIEASLWAFSASFAIVIPVALFFALRGAAGFTPRLSGLPRMVGYGAAFAVNLSLVALNLRVGVFLLGHMAGAEDAGYFFAATRINEIFLEVATAFGLVIFSRMLQSEGGGARLQQNVRISCWMLWSFFLGGWVVTLLAPWLLTIIVGPGYESSIPLLQIMALALGPSAAVKIIYPALAGQGKPLFGTVAVLSSVVLNAVLAYILIEPLGATGAAIGFVAAQYLVLAIYIVMLKYRFGIAVSDFLLPRRQDAAQLAGVLVKFARRQK
jgi:O-antigen/teichoic acid export membrane protein